MNESLNQHAYQPFPPPPQPDPKPLVSIGCAFAVLGALAGLVLAIRAYDEINTGYRSRTESTHWHLIGAWVDLPLGIAQLVPLIYGAYLLNQHKRIGRVLILAGCAVAFTQAGASTVFDWLWHSSMLSHSVKSSIESALAGLAGGWGFPAFTAFLLTRPAMSGWFTPAEDQPGTSPTLPPTPRDPKVPVVISGAAALLAIAFATFVAFDDSGRTAAPAEIDVAQRILAVVQVALLFGGLAGMFLRHRSARILIVAGATLALINAVLTGASEWLEWSDYQTVPKSLLDFAFTIAFAAGPAVAAATIILTPRAKDWFVQER